MMSLKYAFVPPQYSLFSYGTAGIYKKKDGTLLKSSEGLKI
jgi:hypothetical protein